MRFEREKLAEFFALGRSVGWDTETQSWKLNQLMDVKGRVPTLGELVGSLDPAMLLKWSGDRFGAPRLREHIAASQGYRLGPEHVLVTLGCQNANLLAALALISPGDEVLLELPTWMHMHGVCKGLGARVRTIARREELGWQFDPAELHAAFTAGTRLFYLCQPNNPTGAAFTREQLQAILAEADRVGAYVICDEIYRGLEWAGEISPVAAELYPRAVSTSSVSKTIGLDGLRIGWLLTQDRQLLETCCRIKQYVSTPHISGLDELVCTAALEPARYARLIEASRALGLRNRAVVARWVEAEPAFNWVPPAAGFMGFPRYSLPQDSWSLCRRLLDEPYRTYVVPGACYEMEHHIRIGFGSSSTPDQVRAGLSGISRIARQLSGPAKEVADR